MHISVVKLGITTSSSHCGQARRGSLKEAIVWTQECARYLETYKSYESKPADAIQGRTEEDYLSRLNAAVTSVRGVNKTDALTLAGAFKTAAGIMRASMQDLSVLPGIGPTKVMDTSSVAALCMLNSKHIAS